MRKQEFSLAQCEKKKLKSNINLYVISIVNYKIIIYNFRFS